MKLKKQQMIIIGVIIIVIILIGSVAVVMMFNNDVADNSNNNDDDGIPSDNNGGTNGGDGDDVDGDNGGSQLSGNWINLSSNINAVATDCGFGYTDYSDVFFVDENEGWVTSSCIAEIYHTTDGGESWEMQTTQFPCNAIWMISKNEGYAGGDNGRVYRTTDGGKNWNAIGGIGNTLSDISFSSGASTGFVCGQNSAYAKIGPEGVTMIEKITNGDIGSVSATGPDEAYFFGCSLMLHYNGSGMWADQDRHSTGYIYANFMLNSKQGWAAGADIIINTVDGENWFPQTSPTTNRGMFDVFFLNENEGWVIGERGLIMHTTNGGTTWTVEAEGVTDNYLRAVHFPSSNVGYICGNEGTLLKYVGEG